MDLGESQLARRAIYDTAHVNAERAPSYLRIDLRVDRSLQVGGNAVRVFAGAQNVTNRRNFAGYTWDRRGNVLKRLDQLGVFPVLGLEWQF